MAPTVGRPILLAPPAALRALSFQAGWMAPKVEAACRFVERTGKEAAIGALEEAERVLAGEAGTHVAADIDLVVELHQTGWSRKSRAEYEGSRP